METTKKPMTLMCVQPCIQYYAWQVEVMLRNFERLKIHESYDIHCLFAYNKKEHDWESKIRVIEKVQLILSHVASFYYYEDTRVYPVSYISSIRPNLLKQHYKNNPYLSCMPVFYHDCDIIFTKFPHFFSELLADNNWYVSNTKSYIGYQYIISKGEDVLELMCNIVGISTDVIRERQEQSGGAQYLMKGVDWHFFDKMELNCENLYKEVTELNNYKKVTIKNYHELQIWCADMWAILWGAWLKGYNTKIVPELDFSWATDNIDTYEKRYIFHNAGVVSGMSDKLFFKANFRDKHPFLHEGENYDKTKASYKYFEEIKSIADKSCLI